MSEVNVPKVLLSNGTSIPILGLGTWGSDWGVTLGQKRGTVEQAVNKTPPWFTVQKVKLEMQLMKKLKKELSKEDLYIVSKLWNTFHRTDLVRGSLLESLKNLNTPYLDLYLIHLPTAHKEDQGLFPVDDKGNVLFSFVDFVETWKEMEKLVDDSSVKSIGISNFSKRQTERLLANARIKPVTNQVECTPYLTQSKLSEYLRSKQITLTAYSPLGSPARPWVDSTKPILLEDPVIHTLAAKYNKKPAQIILRYQIEKGHIVIPKSANKTRLADNITIFDFKFNEVDIAAIDNLNKNLRFFPNDINAAHPDFPFTDEY